MNDLHRPRRRKNAVSGTRSSNHSVVHPSAWTGPFFSGASLSGGISGIFRSGSTSGTGGIISGSCFLGSPFIAFTFLSDVEQSLDKRKRSPPNIHTSRHLTRLLPTLEQNGRAMPPPRELVVLGVRQPHSLGLSLGAHTITGAAWEPFLFRIVCLRAVAPSCFRPTTHLGRFCKSSKWISCSRRG